MRFVLVAEGRLENKLPESAWFVWVPRPKKVAFRLQFTVALPGKALGRI